MKRERRNAETRNKEYACRIVLVEKGRAESRSAFGQRREADAGVGKEQPGKEK